MAGAVAAHAQESEREQASRSRSGCCPRTPSVPTRSRGESSCRRQPREVRRRRAQSAADEAPPTRSGTKAAATRPPAKRASAAASSAKRPPSRRARTARMPAAPTTPAGPTSRSARRSGRPTPGPPQEPPRGPPTRRPAVHSRVAPRSSRSGGALYTTGSVPFFLVGDVPGSAPHDRVPDHGVRARGRRRRRERAVCRRRARIRGGRVSRKRCGCSRPRAKPARRARAATTTSASASTGFATTTRPKRRSRRWPPSFRRCASSRSTTAVWRCARTATSPTPRVAFERARVEHRRQDRGARERAARRDRRAADRRRAEVDGLFRGRARLRRQRGAAERARPPEQRSVEPARGSARRPDARFRAEAAALRCERLRRALPRRRRFRPDRGSAVARGRASARRSGRCSSARRWGAPRSMATGSRSSSAPTYDCAVASAWVSFSKPARSTTIRTPRIRASPTSTALAGCFRLSMQHTGAARVRAAYDVEHNDRADPGVSPSRERWSVVYQRRLSETWPRTRRSRTARAATVRQACRAKSGCWSSRSPRGASSRGNWTLGVEYQWFDNDSTAAEFAYDGQRVALGLSRSFYGI